MSLTSLLQPFEVKGVDFRNRVVSTSHAPGYAEDGLPLERYQRYHEEKARGGAAMTMFGGSSIVSPEVSPIYRQIDVSTDAVIPHFRTFARRIHGHGARLMCQISHMGRRTTWDEGDWIVPIAPSAVRDPAHHAMPRSMEIEDIERIIDSYGSAAARCAEGGLDGVEILVPSHLPGQFLSPDSNKRTDEWGGSLEHRMRFLHEVLRRVRRRTPDSFLVALRLAVDESAEGGPGADECATVARLLAEAGLYDLLNISGIAASTTPGMSQLIGSMARPIAPYLKDALAFRARVGAVAVIHASRVIDVETAAHAVESGATDLVGMTRALMADPHLVQKLTSNQPHRIRPCVGAAYCIDRIYMGRDALCAHNPATGREEIIPQVVEISSGPRRRVVIVGGGPAGLEAARVAAARGHHVVLFEAADRRGGQVLVAARAAWRRDLVGIVDWLVAEVRTLGVDVRLGEIADSSSILSERPDIVVLATGGTPSVPDVPGAELLCSPAELLSGERRALASVIVYDEEGRHAGISTAQHLAERGVNVTLVTPDRLIGRELGEVSMGTYLPQLSSLSVETLTDHRLDSIERIEDRHRAWFRHEHDPSQRRHLDAELVVAAHGTVPNDNLFHELKPASANRGQVDVWALKAGTPQPVLDADLGPGHYALFAVGDAVASRDVHAAILDARRLMQDA
jgi:2,4-dienoyl-CoA reductase-like NADH-dependent reductase (Old Yellow Enzyme family)